MISSVLLSLCAGSVYLLAFICLLNPGKANNPANRWVGLFLVCFGLALSSDLCDQLGISQQYRLITAISEITRFVLAPAFFLGVLYFTTPDRAFGKKDWLHFILFFLFLVNSLPYLLDGSPYLLNRIDSNVAGPIIRTLMLLIIKGQVLAYWIASYIILTRHQKNIRMIFSSLAPVNLNWLKYFLFTLFLAILIWFNNQFFDIAFIKDYSALGYLIVIYLLSYFLLKQKEVFPFPQKETEEIREIINPTDLSRTERIPASRIEPLSNRLMHLMTTEKHFLNPQLELPELAARVGLSAHELSYLLNQGLKQNFFEFVNGFRVEHAKQLLLSDDHSHLNILGIAFESGFNSKTTFNTAFKKVTGLSPSQFKKESRSTLKVLRTS